MSDIPRTYIDLFDVVVYDALACNSKWTNHCVNLGVDVIVRAKDNNINSLRQVKKHKKKEPIEIWEKEKGFESVRIFESTFKMDNVDQTLRFVKFAMKHKNGKYLQIMIITTCLEMSLKTLFKMIRARWDIKN